MASDTNSDIHDSDRDRIESFRQLYGQDQARWRLPPKQLPPILEAGMSMSQSSGEGPHNGARRSSSVPNLHAFAACEHTISGMNSKRTQQIWRKYKIENYQHKERLYSILSLLYAIFVMVLGVALPIAELFGNNSNDVFVGSFEGFYVYLFVVSISFLLFVHLFIVQDIHIPPFVLRMRRTIRRNNSAGFKEEEEKAEASSAFESRSSATLNGNRNMSLDSHAHSGSFYLRLGAVGFGIGDMIHEGLQFGQFFEEDLQDGCVRLVVIVRPLLQLIFTFSQTYFIFRNSKMIIHKYRILARFGLMHLVATNLCVWFRVIVMETLHELHAYFGHGSDHHGSDDHGSGNSGHYEVGNGSHSSGSDQGQKSGTHSSGKSGYGSGHGTVTHNDSDHVTVSSLFSGLHYGDNDLTTADPCKHHVTGGLLAKAVDDVSPYLFACTVEFSLILAGVMYLMWRNITRRNRTSSSHESASHDAPASETDLHYSECETTSSGKEPHTTEEEGGKSSVQRMRVDCSGANRGLFIGIFMLIATIISLVIFFALSNKKQFHTSAVIVMYISELVLYVMTILSVCGAAYQFKDLKFSAGSENSLDEILLLVALVGVYVFCVFSIICGSHQLNVPLGSLVVVTSVLVLFQSTIQTLFILNGLKRSAATSAQEMSKPGRQYVTFLVVANTALWAINSFEVLRADSNPVEMNFYGTLPWSLITHISVPLAIFYRYHSTVCLADIWKDAYKIKSGNHHH